MKRGVTVISLRQFESAGGAGEAEAVVLHWGQTLAQHPLAQVKDIRSDP